MIASTHHHRHPFALALAAAALTCSCNFIVEPDRVQCKTDDDCTSRGEAFQGTVCVRSMCQKDDPLWGCVNRPPSPPAGPGPFNITIHAQGILDSKPIAGAAVTLCRKIDAECQDPETKPPLVTDDNGDVTLEIRNAFSGFVSIVKKDPSLGAADQLVDAYYYFNPAINSDLNVSVQMATVGLRGGLTGFLNSPQQDDRGLVLLNVLNCQGTAGGGVVFKSDGADDMTKTFYVSGGLPDDSLTATDPSGFGGFVNIHSETVTITGEVQETGQLIDTISAVVRPNTITYSRLVARGH